MAEEVTLEVFAKDVANGSDAARLALAQQLKNAGFWTGSITSDFNVKYYNALVKLEGAYKSQVALNKMVGSTKPVTRYDVLLSSKEESAGTGGPTTTNSSSSQKRLLAQQKLRLIKHLMLTQF
jgi:hypothetical protein